MKKFIFAKELAEILNVSLHQVYRLVRANLIPYFRLGGKIMFDLEQIEAFTRSGGKGYEKHQ